MKRIIISSLLFLMPFAQATEGIVEPFNAKRTIYAALCVVSAYAIGRSLIRFFTPDKTLPCVKDLNIITFAPLDKHLSSEKVIVDKKETDEMLSKRMFRYPFLLKEDTLYKVEQGVPKLHKGLITIVSDGFPCHSRPLPLYPYNLIKNGAVNGAVVYFTYPTDHNRKMFSFCQEQDITALDLVVQEIKKENPGSDILLYGMCKGATNILRYLARKKELQEDVSSIKAAIIESPTLSAQRAFSQYPLVHTIIRLTRPHYDPKGKTILDDKDFPNIPILIGHLPHDHIAKSEDVKKIHSHIERLKEAYEQPLPTEMITIEDTTVEHGRMPQHEEYIQTINRFVDENFKKEGK